MITRIFLLTVVLCCVPSAVSAQTAKKVPSAAEPAAAITPFAASPAYAELLVKKTELAAQLESMILEYTDEYPKVIEIRHVLTLIERESRRLSKLKPADAPRLTLALGKLVVRKIELETDLWNLQKNYKDEHPEVKRAKRKVEIYEAAIGEILN